MAFASLTHRFILTVFHGASPNISTQSLNEYVNNVNQSLFSICYKERCKDSQESENLEWLKNGWHWEARKENSLKQENERLDAEG